MSRIRLRTLSAAMAVAGVLGPAPAAMALWDDRLELFAAQSFTHDNNIFRISRSVDPEMVLGSPDRGDTYRTTTFGFDLDVPISAQRFVAGLSFNQYRYDRFDVLDLDGHDGRLAWFWQAGNRLSGRLAYAESEMLASLANVQSGVQSSVPNFITTKRSIVDATYRLTARWELRGELDDRRYSNSEAERLVSDAGIDRVDVSLNYVTPAENRLGLSVRRLDGDLPNPQSVNGTLVDNSYRERGIAAGLIWNLTGHSRLTLRTGPIERTFDQLPERNYDDWMYYAAYDWQPTGKLTLTATASKDISESEEINVGFVVAEGLAVDTTWKATDKIDVLLHLERSDRRYLGDAGLVLGTLVDRSETVDRGELRVSYRPLRVLTLTFGLRRDRRSATFEFGDYEADVASVGFRLAF